MRPGDLLNPRVSSELIRSRGSTIRKTDAAAAGHESPHVTLPDAWDRIGRICPRDQYVIPIPFFSNVALGTSFPAFPAASIKNSARQQAQIPAPRRNRSLTRRRWSS